MRTQVYVSQSVVRVIVTPKETPTAEPRVYLIHKGRCLGDLIALTSNAIWR